METGRLQKVHRHSLAAPLLPFLGWFGKHACLFVCFLEGLIRSKVNGALHSVTLNVNWNCHGHVPGIAQGQICPLQWCSALLWCLTRAWALPVCFRSHIYTGYLDFAGFVYQSRLWPGSLFYLFIVALMSSNMCPAGATFSHYLRTESKLLGGGFVFLNPECGS